jgi:CubicO group peptidase (beta-lactamase class C family)
MLHERLAHFCDSPYGELVGLYASAGDLGRWGRAMVDVVRGRERPGFPRPATVADHLAAAGAVEGPAYAAGLAVRWREHGLEQAPDHALGQFGFVRSTLLYLDPVHETVLAGTITDLSLDDLDRRLAQWDRAVGALRHDIGVPVPAV